MSFGGGNETTQTTQATAYAPWIGNMQQALAGIALGQNLDKLYASPYSKAGFNLDQEKAFDLARTGVNQYGYGTPGALGGAQKYLDGSQIKEGIGQTTAARLGGTDYQEFMNPYLDDVGRDVVDSLRREYDNNSAKMAAKAASSVAFGGSGDQIGQAQLARGFNQDAASTVNQLMSQGFDRATSLADRNVDREQQARQLNANNALSRAATNAGNSLAAGGLYGQLYGDDFNRARLTLADLLDTGGVQQQFAQGAIDAPYEALQRLAGYIPGVYDQVTTGTQPDNSPSTLQQLLGLGLTIGGMPTAGGGSLLGSWLS